MATLKNKGYLLSKNIWETKNNASALFADNPNLSKMSDIILLVSDSFFSLKSWEFEIKKYSPKFSILEG